MSLEYATTLTVLDSTYDVPASLSDLARRVCAWAGIEESPLKNLETTGTNGSRVVTQLLDPDDRDQWAWRLRLEATSEDRTRVMVDWIATVTILEGSETKVSVYVERMALEERLRPLGTRSRPPRVVRELIDDAAFRVVDGRTELTSRPSRLEGTSLEPFVFLLFDESRRLPVVGISQGGRQADPPSADRIASELCGLAHVWVVPSQVTWNLSDAISPALSVYNGAVRLWWAGMERTDDRFEHPLWLPRVGPARIETDVVDTVLDTAETRFSEPREVVELEERMRRQQDYALRKELDELLDLVTKPPEEPSLDAAERTRLEESVRTRIEKIEQDREAALGDLVASEQDRERLTRENARLQSENYQLRARAGFWADDGDREESLELGPEEAFLREVEEDYEARFTGADRQRYPLAPIRVGRQFLATLDQLDLPRRKVIQVCAEVACRRAREISGRQPHPLRTSDGGNARQRRRASEARLPGDATWRTTLPKPQGCTGGR